MNEKDTRLQECLRLVVILSGFNDALGEYSRIAEGEPSSGS